MYPRQLRQLASTFLTVAGLEAVLLYLSRGSPLWREMLVPVHLALGAWVLVGAWNAVRQRRASGDRRRGERRREGA